MIANFKLSKNVWDQLGAFGLDVLGAFVILVVGWVVSNLISRWLKKILFRSEQFDDTLAPIIGDTVKVAIIAVTLIMVLSRFGVRTTSLVALLGSIAIGIGLALQGTLSNIASGIMLLTLRPFSKGDMVNLNGTIGVIDKIGLFVIELHSLDNVYISLPNSNVWSNKIENYTRNSTRRIDLTIGIHYDDDIDKAMSIINDIIKADERVLAEPEPLIAVRGLGDSSVNILLRPWTHPDDWWKLQLDLNKRIKQRFDEEDITIPFPQRDVHFFGEEGGGNHSSEEEAK